MEIIMETTKHDKTIATVGDEVSVDKLVTFPELTETCKNTKTSRKSSYVWNRLNCIK